MAKRVKIGDIIQILTSEGISYAQYTHKNKMYGYMISVFNGLYDNPIKDFSSLIKSPIQFHTFIALQSAINEGLLSVVAHLSIPDHLREFPIFRCRSGGPGGGIWLWDGNEEVMLNRNITEEEQKYSTRSIISIPLLLERIKIKYKPEINQKY